MATSKHRTEPEKAELAAALASDMVIYGRMYGLISESDIGSIPVNRKRSQLKSILTKQALKLQLQQGHTLNDLLAFGPGQDCEIFKADKFYPGDVVIYVPDVSLNQIPLDRPIKDQEELDEVLSQCYTGRDFIDECGGDAEKAKRLFYYCDWQHPSSAVDELDDDEEES